MAFSSLDWPDASQDASQQDMASAFNNYRSGLSSFGASPGPVSDLGKELLAIKRQKELASQMPDATEAGIKSQQLLSAQAQAIEDEKKAQRLYQRKPKGYA